MMKKKIGTIFTALLLCVLMAIPTFAFAADEFTVAEGEEQAQEAEEKEEATEETKEEEAEETKEEATEETKEESAEETKEETSEEAKDDESKEEVKDEEKTDEAKEDEKSDEAKEDEKSDEAKEDEKADDEKKDEEKTDESKEDEAKEEVKEFDVLFSKVDKDGKAIAGVKYELTQNDGVKAGFVTRDDSVITLKLTSGFWVLKEVETPSGYEKGTDIGFFVAEDGKITLAEGMTNVKLEDGKLVVTTTAIEATQPDATKSDSKTDTKTTTTTATTTKTTATKTTSTNPKTGDNEVLVASGVLIALAGGLFVALRKRQSFNR